MMEFDLPVHDLQPLRRRGAQGRQVDYAGLRDEEPFIVPMHRITMMTTSAFRHTGHRCSGQRVSIRSPEMPSRRLCLPIELRKTARKS